MIINHTTVRHQILQCNKICNTQLQLTHVETVSYCHTVLYLSLMKQQFVITHTTRHTEIPTLLDSWVTNTPSIQMLCP